MDSPPNQRAGSSLAEKRARLRTSLRLAWIATMIVIARTVAFVLFEIFWIMGADPGHSFTVFWWFASYSASITAWALLVVCVARTGSIVNDRSFRLARTAAMTVLILFLIGRFAKLISLVEIAALPGWWVWMLNLPLLLLVPPIAIMAHGINRSTGGRLYDRRIFLVTVVVASITILVTSTPLLTFVRIAVYAALEPFVGNAALPITAFLLCLHLVIFCVWMLIVLRWSSKRLLDAHGCVACGYDLTGLAGDRCSECGHVVAPLIEGV